MTNRLTQSVASVDVGRGRGGFTLLELVASMISVGILLLGLMSTLIVASRATNLENTPAPAAIDSATVLEQLSSDLNSATGFVTWTGTAVEFTVPDRDNNGSDETIRVEWSGNSGSPLQRKVNAGPLSTIADNVHNFSLEYETLTTGSGNEAATYLTRVIATLQISKFNAASTTLSCQTLNQPKLGP
ncbi:MAG: hypothetical protein O3A00_07680 [Planctomycetota bacterium]|nr:hypothetical protein [Planctomycetota bacterium]